MKANWKMYGIWICGFTIIPCYYDLLRYLNKANKALKYRRRYINVETIWYRYNCVFDASLQKL